MPKSSTFTQSGRSSEPRRVATSGPNPSSAKKMLPIPATSTRARVGRGAVAAAAIRVSKSWTDSAIERLHLGRVEVVVAAVPLVELTGRVVLEGHGHVDLAVDVLEHAGDPPV